MHMKCTEIKRKDQKEDWHKHVTCNLCKDPQNEKRTCTPTKEPPKNPKGNEKAKEPNKGVTYCCICKEAIRKITLNCQQCKRYAHQTCINTTRTLINMYKKEKNWTCEDCIQNNSRIQNDNRQAKNTKQHGTRSKNKKRKITVLQWNCDGLFTKIPELTSFLNENSIDIACLQETKLTSKDKLPSFQDYNVLRKDSTQSTITNVRRGGLIILIKKGLAYNPLKTQDQEHVETQAIRIYMSKKKSITCLNMYIPPQSQRAIPNRMHFNGNLLPQMKLDLICADVNMHDPLWDHQAKPDRNGEILADWIEDKDLTVLNNGKPTRYARSDGRGSAPDITMANSELASQIQWRTKEDMGSDHLPILITGCAEIKNLLKKKKIQKYNWEKANIPEYQAYIIEHSQNIDLNAPIQEQYKDWTKILIDATKKNVPKNYMGTKKKSWKTPAITKQIKKRQNLHKRIGTKRKEWIEQCKKVRQLTNKRKAEIWREQVNKACEEKDLKRLWRTARNLKGTGNAISQDVSLSYKGRIITTDKKKANAFIQHYAEVSALKTDKNMRQIKNEVANHLKKFQYPQEEDEQDLTMNEMIYALKRNSTGKATGRDQLSAENLSNLPTEGKEWLLYFMNHSWSHSWVPQEWKEAIIIPIPKEGKPAGEVASYRPISLTSIVSKTFERIIERRLRYRLESRKQLTKDQFGFRSRRSTEDALLVATQKIENGFEERKKTLAILYDFEKAFDKMWRNGLLKKLIELNVPNKFIKWIKNWFTNRQARVKLRDSYSRSRKIKEGVPQGGVLSPLLFIIFMNDILEEINNKQVGKIMFADDLTAYSQGKNKNELKANMQWATDKISEWATKWKMKINETKTVSLFFSLDELDKHWNPEIKLNGTTIPKEMSAKLLGVTLDTKLTYKEHTANVRTKMTNVNNLLRMLKGTHWGCKRKTQRMIYLAMGRSVAEYASPVWSNNLPENEKEKLEVTQRKALRNVTSLTRTTPTEAIYQEANLPRLQVRHTNSSAYKLDNWMRKPQEDIRRQVVDSNPKKRLKRKSWLKANSTLKEEWDTLNLEPNIGEVRKPWKKEPPNLKITETNIKKTDSIDEQKEASQQAIKNEKPADFIIYTDGSAIAGTRNGGAGIYVEKAEGERDYRKYHTEHHPAGSYSTSYTAECVAMLRALRWLENQTWLKTVIVTDSKALTSSLTNDQTNSPKVSKIKKKIEDILDNGLKFITILWVPGHSGLNGNEEADNLAKQGTSLNQEEAEIDIESAKAIIKERLTPKEELKHQTLKKIYTRKIQMKEEDSALSNEQQANLSRFRSTHHPKLNYWRKKTGKIDDDRCRLCKMGTEDTEHLTTDCPALYRLRSNTLGTPFPTVDVLTTKYRGSAAFVEATLRRLL